MKTHYDADTDALYLRFVEVPVSESEEVRPGIVFDFDDEGRIVAVEILDASEHLASGADMKVHAQIDPHPEEHPKGAS